MTTSDSNEGASEGTFTALRISQDDITQLIRRSRTVRIIRSGFARSILPDWVEAIAEGCKQKRPTKSIRIILPRQDNIEIDERCKDIHVFDGKSIDVRAKLAEWCNALTQLKNEVKPHSIEVQLTHRPHRYHAFSGDGVLYIGLAWHFSPSMSAKTLRIATGSELESHLADPFIDDFEAHWNELISRQSEAIQSNGKRTLRGMEAPDLRVIEVDILSAMYQMYTSGKATFNVRDVAARCKKYRQGEVNDAMRDLTEIGILGYLKDIPVDTDGEWIPKGNDSVPRKARSLTQIGIFAGEHLLKRP